MSLRVEGLWKKYDAHPVLCGLDLEVERGEIYGLLGPNGSGKSTALQIVAGLLESDRGEVSLGGRPLSNHARARLGFVPQEPALYPTLSCAETLRFFGRIYGVPRQTLGDRVENAIRSTGLQPYRDVRAQALSGGWRQRLSVACALVHEPELLVLDEPTTGLDVKVRGEVWRLIGALADGGTAVLLATHGLDEIETHCHRVGIIKAGRIAAEGSPDELSDLVPAVQIAEVEVDDDVGLLARSGERGWAAQQRDDRWLLRLRTPTTLAGLAQDLADAGPRALSLRPVKLEDVYLEVTGGAESRTDAPLPESQGISFSGVGES